MPDSISYIKVMPKITNKQVINQIMSWTKSGTIIWHYNNHWVLASALYSTYLGEDSWLIELALDASCKNFEIRIKDMQFQRKLKTIKIPRDEFDFFGFIRKCSKLKNVREYLKNVTNMKDELRHFLEHIDPNVKV